MGAPRRVDYERVRVIHEQCPGLSYEQLGARFGVSHTTVARILMDDEARHRHDAHGRLWLIAAQPFCANPDCLNRVWTAYHESRTGGLCVDCWNAKRRADRAAAPRHGTESEYGYGCRCQACKAASAAGRRRRRALAKKAKRA